MKHEIYFVIFAIKI